MPFHETTLELLEQPTSDQQQAFKRFVDACGNAHVFWERGDRADWMLEVLRQGIAVRAIDPRPLQRQLRRFACWSAREWQPTGTQFDLILAAAERACEQIGKIAELDALRRNTHAAALPALTLGLPHRHVNAAAVLSAWHAANPDALAAAVWASRFAALAAVYELVQNNKEQMAWPPEGRERMLESHRAWWYQLTHQILVRAQQAAFRIRQAEVLRFILPNPFDKAERDDRPNAAGARTE